jgi:hypothetical protein
MVRYSVLSFLLAMSIWIGNRLLSILGEVHLEYGRKHHSERTI